MRLTNPTHKLVPAVLLVTLAAPPLHAGNTAQPTDWQLPNESSRYPFADDTPIVFIDRTRKAAEWDELMRTFQEPVAEARPGEWWASMECVFDLDDHV